MAELKHKRNFSIIAHIDHGKSTLADRILDFTGALSVRERKAQFLDSMDIERERGITIKSSTVRLNYTSVSGQEYLFNLIDTPGHVDFSYEVSRSLAACEGAILVVDATQGVEAQTLANAYLATDNGLEIIPVINKIDLQNAEVEKTRKQIEEIIGIESTDAILASAKDGTGTRELLEAIVEKIPPPTGDPAGTLRALIFDSWYDPYQGAVALFRIFDGTIRKGMKISLMSTKNRYEVLRLGVFAPFAVDLDELTVGDVGFFSSAIKDVREMKIGDTITGFDKPASVMLPGFKEIKPMVFSGLFPTDSSQYPALNDAVRKLSLNDSSFTFEPENSLALGFGFRCGFLGLLHMEIIQQRLEREFELDLITTAPTVVYRVRLTDGKVLSVDNPAKMPDQTKIEAIEEPIIRITVHAPSEYVGNILKLCEEKRGEKVEMKYYTIDRVMIIYDLPLSEMVLEFFDRLKSLTRGYASMDYEFQKYKVSDLVKLDILINGDPVDTLSAIIHKERAYSKGRDLALKMKEIIPKQMFEVAIQAAIGNRVIARETKSAMRKNVTAKCYGGDITRKRKLLEKQKEGKKRMKQVGRVEIPQEAFLAILKI
jgi:GTP-binding protein LepA